MSGAGMSKPISKQLHQKREKRDTPSPLARMNTNFRVGSWNVGTIKGRSGEVVETLQRRNIDLCCLQEVRFAGKGCRMI